MLSRNRPEPLASNAEQFSPTRTDNPLSVLVGGEVPTSVVTSTSALIESGGHCFFVNGEWNCVGERCSNPRHRPD